MNAGKSTSLLQSSYNYQERGMDTFLLIPKLDSRFGVKKITSRIGLQKEANVFDHTTDLYVLIKQQQEKCAHLKCILVDEAQFLSEQQVKQLAFVTDDLNLPVLAYGLRTDFLGNLFEGSMWLLGWADHLVELKTICHCGRKAIMNLRTDQNGKVLRAGEQVLIGGNECYTAVCRKHFRLGMIR